MSLQQDDIHNMQAYQLFNNHNRNVHYYQKNILYYCLNIYMRLKVYEGLYAGPDE